MDPDAPLTVAKGVAATCLVNSITFSVYGTLKGLPVGPLAASAGLNGGIVGATFFSFREYVISPQLLLNIKSGQYSRRMAQLQAVKDGEKLKEEKLDWWDMRAHMVPDTAISGALTGGVLNSWKRGKAGIIPGAVTASVFCTLLQLAYNELGVLRIKYVSEQLQSAQSGTATHPATSPIPQEPATSPAPSQPVSEKLLGWLGFQRVSDEDYLTRLKSERDGHLRRIAELEEQRNETDKP